MRRDADEAWENRGGTSRILPRNRILACLSPKEVSSLTRRLERVTFESGTVVFRPGETPRYVYFPEDAVISVVATAEDGRGVEVGLTGAEGFLHTDQVRGATSYLYEGLVEIPGSCLRMKMESFNAEFMHSGMLSPLIAYFRYALVQARQIAACNRLHRVRQRLARRLLMIQDCVQKDEFPMTHEALSYVLGTPRPEVSLAAESLRYAGIVAYARGNMTVLDRSGLECVSCECYNVIHREFLSIDRMCALSSPG